MQVVVLVSTEIGVAAELAAGWVHDGAAVTVVLLDAAAGHARAGHAGSATVTGLLSSNVAVLAHDAALRRRGIRQAALAEGVKVCDLDEVADLLTDAADRVMWL